MQKYFGGAGFMPVSDRSEINIMMLERRPDPTSSTRGSRPRKWRASRARIPEVAYTYTSIGGATPSARPAWTRR